MSTSRGFVSPILILIVIGLVVLGGVGYYVTKQSPVSQSTENTVSTTNQNSSDSNQWPTIQSFTGPSSLAVGESGTWTVKATDPQNNPITFVVTWGDEPATKPADIDVTHPLNRAALGYAQKFSSVTVQHSYKNPGTYSINLVAFGPDASRSGGGKTLTVTVHN